MKALILIFWLNISFLMAQISTQEIEVTIKNVSNNPIPFRFLEGTKEIKTGMIQANTSQILQGKIGVVIQIECNKTWKQIGNIGQKNTENKFIITCD
jgi:hypothetical protein